MRLLAAVLVSCLWSTQVWAASASMTSGYMWSPYPGYCHQGTSFNTSVLNAAGDDVAFVFQAPSGVTVAALGFRTGTVTTGDTVDVRLETVSTTDGTPTGTLCTTNSNASQAIADANDNVWFTTTLTASCTLTAETFYAVVINAPAGWVAGNFQIVTQAGDQITQGWSYKALDTGTGYAKSACSGCVFLVQDNSSNPVDVGGFPVSALASTSYDSGSAADERANIFQFPFPVSVSGGWVELGLDAGADVSIILYDSDGTTALETATMDGDVTTGTGTQRKFFFFGTAVALSANTNYRIAIRPDTANNATLPSFTACGNPASATCLDAFDMGQEMHTSTRVNGGSWTQTTTTRECIGLAVSAADDGTGGSSTGGGTWGF